MKTLNGENIKLRALEPSDLDFLYQMENDESLWEVSNTSTPFSRFILNQYLENSHKDIFEIKQLRLVICISKTEQVIGCIDLFDFEPNHHRIGVGIVILSEENKQKGYASEALNLLCKYAFIHLKVHQVFANIPEDNTPSIQLFENNGFKLSGTKIDWIYSHGTYKNELQYQLLNNVY